MNTEKHMSLETFYRIDPATGKLSKAHWKTPDYPLPEGHSEPVVYIDKEDDTPYASGFFSGDHHTFADNTSFGLPNHLDNGLTFIPTVAQVESLFSQDDFSQYLDQPFNSYLYLSTVLDEVTDEVTPYYNLLWVNVL